MVAFPELALTGYPPEDLLLREHFLEDTGAAKLQRAGRHDRRGSWRSSAFPSAPARPGERVYNAAAVLADGAVSRVYRKVHLPNYGVFDEQRYFKPGEASAGTVVIDRGRWNARARHHRL